MPKPSTSIGPPCAEPPLGSTVSVGGPSLAWLTGALAIPVLVVGLLRRASSTGRGLAQGLLLLLSLEIAWSSEFSDSISEYSSPNVHQHIRHCFFLGQCTKID